MALRRSRMAIKRRNIGLSSPRSHFRKSGENERGRAKAGCVLGQRTGNRIALAEAGHRVENWRVAAMAAGTASRGTSTKPSFAKRPAADVVRIHTSRAPWAEAIESRASAIRRPYPHPRCRGNTTTDRRSAVSAPQLSNPPNPTAKSKKRRPGSQRSSTGNPSAPSASRNAGRVPGMGVGESVKSIKPAFAPLIVVLPAVSPLPAAHAFRKESVGRKGPLWGSGPVEGQYPMPPPGIGGDGALSLTWATITSVVIKRPAIDPAP